VARFGLWMLDMEVGELWGPGLGAAGAGWGGAATGGARTKPIWAII
jgi:hypothetical protein